MSDGAPRPSIADALYGPDGPATDRTAFRDRNLAVDAPSSTPSQSRRSAERPDHATALYGADGPRSTPSRTDWQPLPPAPGDKAAPVAFDPTKLTFPEGFEPDSAAMTEFGTAARDLKLDHAGAERLVALHTKALDAQAKRHEAQVDNWAREAQDHYGDHLPRVAADIRTAIGDDRDGAEFLRLMNWSGLGSNASVLRVLHRLARRY